MSHRLTITALFGFVFLALAALLLLTINAQAAGDAGTAAVNAPNPLCNMAQYRNGPGCRRPAARPCERYKRNGTWHRAAGCAVANRSSRPVTRSADAIPQYSPPAASAPPVQYAAAPPQAPVAPASSASPPAPPSASPPAPSSPPPALHPAASGGFVRHALPFVGAGGLIVGGILISQGHDENDSPG